MATDPWCLRLVVLVAALASCSYDQRVAVVDGPPPGGRFPTIPPGQPLPGDAECAARVYRSPWEPRPENAIANGRAATAAERAQLVTWNGALGYDERAGPLGARVTGAFTGTTDEILQWVACKWGFEDDLVRAMAADTSRWRQTAVACWTTTTTDCPPDGETRSSGTLTECAICYGILQIAWKYHRWTWPAARASTALNADYVTGLLRACFEGYATYLAPSADPAHPYQRGDVSGCVGALFSGGWYDVSGLNHAAATQTYQETQPWRAPGF